LFEDASRGVKGIKPFARLRLRRFENDNMEVAIPETTTYGADFPDFVQATTNWARDAQPEFVVGDAGYSKRPKDWKLTGGTYQDSESSELFDNFFDREDDDAGFGEPTEDEYDPYGEGYTLDDSPYYDPDREDEDEGEAEVAEKSVEPWRDTDKMTDFWTWMDEAHPKVTNPNRRGTKKKMTHAVARVVSSGNHRLNTPAGPDLARIAPRWRHAQTMLSRNTIGRRTIPVNVAFCHRRLPSPVYSSPSAPAVMPLRSWAVSPKPIPLPALTSTTTPFLSAGIMVRSVSTPGLEPECQTVPFSRSRNQPRP